MHAGVTFDVKGTRSNAEGKCAIIVRILYTNSLVITFVRTTQGWYIKILVLIREFAINFSL